MTAFPPLPNWDGFHPLVVDFTIALLVTAPLLVLISVFARRTERPWMGAALLLMALGTVAAWLATGSGHAAATLIERSRELAGPVMQHERLAILTRNLFTLLTLIFAVLLLPALAKRPLPVPAAISLRVVFLLLYVGCTMVLGNAAWRGARLVHEYGIHAVVPAPAGDTAAPVAQR